MRPWDQEGIMGESFHELTESDKNKALLKYIKEIELNGFFDHHHLPQYYFLNGLHPNAHNNHRRISSITNFLFLNNLEEDISEMLGKKIKIPHANKRKHSSLLADEVAESIKKIMPSIKALYKEDFEIYKLNKK